MKNEFTWCKRDGRGAPWKLIEPTDNAIYSTALAGIPDDA